MNNYIFEGGMFFEKESWYLVVFIGVCFRDYIRRLRRRRQQHPQLQRTPYVPARPDTAARTYPAWAYTARTYAAWTDSAWAWRRFFIFGFRGNVDNV